MSETGFTDQIRAQIRHGAISSAGVIAPLVMAEFPGVRHVIDVGCGEGWFAAAFRELGCAVVGVDHPDPIPMGLDADEWHGHDLREPLPDLGRFDLAVCLEVAEHLPPERGESFVADLCALAPIVLFSAAIPGQGGTGHLNEQPPGYWTELFRSAGFACSGYLRWRIWDDDQVENWYSQNLLVAIKDDRPEDDPHAFHEDTPPAYVVHPVLFDHVRSSR